MKFLKVVFMFLVLFSAPYFSYADANPAPFGLEIGKTTVNEMLAKYKYAKYVGINKYTQGPQYMIDPKHIPFDEIEECSAVFGQNGKLLAVLTLMPKSKFDYIYQLLRSKYKIVNSKIPFVGDRYAKFIAGDTEIILDAPHLSFTMALNYVHKDFVKAYNEITRKEKQEKIQREGSQL